jgi:hypothetical protein
MGPSQYQAAYNSIRIQDRIPKLTLVFRTLNTPLLKGTTSLNKAIKIYPKLSSTFLREIARFKAPPNTRVVAKSITRSSIRGLHRPINRLLITLQTLVAGLKM